MGRRTTAVLALTTGIGAAVLLVAGTTAALALPNEPQVTLCHATPPDTAAQGYVEITVDANAVFKQGHGTEHDEDIIPSFDYTNAEGQTVTYPGKNLDGGGQAILDNGCEAVAPPTTTTATTTTATTTTTTTAPTTTAPTTTTGTTTTGTTTTATTTVPPTTTAAPSPTIGSPPPETGGAPPGRPIPSGPVDAGGTGLYDQAVDPSVASILLVSGGLLLGASTAFTVRWRRYSS